MRRITALFFLLALLLIASTTTAIVYLKSTTVDVMVVPMDVRVGDVLGFNLDTDAIHFGKIPPEHEGIRNVTLANKRDFPLLAELYVEGALNGWVSLSENVITIAPQTNKSIMLIAAVPKDAAYGKHEGNLVVVFRRA